MPNWREVLDEIAVEAKMEATKKNPNSLGAALDTVRRKYLALLFKKTERNVIAYYSGWLQHKGTEDSIINDKDKSGFMVTIHKLDRSKGLDLILHTPGGDLAATESLVDYLKSMFGNDIRAIIPQISMSGGTMIAMSCKSILMGLQSNLGPIDPQMGGVPCHGVLAEFKRAKDEVKEDQSSAYIWQPIIEKYHPTFLGLCAQAIEWSELLAKKWLSDNMLKGKKKEVVKILKEFGDHGKQMSHSRHISSAQCDKLGLVIEEMEKDNDLQDIILTIHHCFMHTFSKSSTVKIIENHLGTAYMELIAEQQLQIPSPREN